MERNGGVVTEFNICFPQRFRLDLDTYSTGNSKMCKDDISPSIFCKIPNSLKSELSMERSGFNPKSGISLEHLDRAQTGCIDSDERMFSVIQQQSDHALNNCYLPAWENSGISSYQTSKLTNGLIPNLVTISDSSLDTTSDSVQNSRNFDDKTNSSVEEVNPFLFKQPLKEKKSAEEPKPPVAQNKQQGGSNKDRSMPELIPLICVEDDDPVKVPEEKMVQESKLTDSPEMPKLIAFSSEEAFRVKKEPQDKTNTCRRRVKLFGDSRIGSILESLADRGSSGGRSPGGAVDTLQPQILMRRVSLEQCSGGGSEKNGGSSTEELENEDKMSCASVLPSNDDYDDGEDDSLSGPFKCADSGKNSSNETPEIEEIEGVRFFQFRLKSDMEEFHEQRKAKVGEDEEMIVPTKTADITQIKGWRHKFFAPGAEYQYPITLETIRAAESASRSSAAPAAPSGSGGEGENGAAESSDKGAVVETSSPADKSKDPGFLKDTKPSMEDLMVLPRPLCNGPVPVIDLTTNNPQSAFESKILDDYLSNEPHLKVSYLEKINPNILPIPPNSSILSLGKLFKPESQVTTLAALKLRNGIALTSSSDAKVEVSPVPLVRLSSDSDSSDDADRSSDDDIPVARLKRTRVGKMVVPGRRVKRIKSDVSSDQSQRVVLRLTKEIQGESKGYKVSEITAEKQEEDPVSSSSSSSTTTTSSSSSSSSSEDSIPAQESIQIVPPGKLEIFKHSMFMNVHEPRLLSEFLANLNSLGTSNDVAMLVQSNQSYFEKSPVLTEEVCREAVEALVLNKDRSDFKSKRSPKKKLKAWQRYLPKKLSVSLQQKISKMTKTKTVSSSQVAESGGLPSSAPSSLGGKPRKKKRLGGKAKLSKEMLESHVEREKRAIRLPARYLDSAVLAAGSEWVSPVFVEEGEKKLPTVARKQLLDVLEKISTSKTEVAITQDASETTSECIVTKEPPCFARKLPKSPPKDGVPNKKAKLGIEGKLEYELKKAKLAYEARKAAKKVDLTHEVNEVNPNEESSKMVKPNTGVQKAKNKGIANKGVNNWRNQMKAIDAMVEDNRDPYPFPNCPYTHCTRTLEYDRIAKELGCTYKHKKRAKKPDSMQTLLCHEKLPSLIEGEESSSKASNNAVSSDASKKAVESSSVEQPKEVPVMCNKGNLILTQQVNPPSGSSNLQLAGDATANKGAPLHAGAKQILLLVPGAVKGKTPPAILPKPAPGAARWPQPASNMNAVWFVQDGELKSRPAVFKQSQPAEGRPPERRRKSPLSVRRLHDDSDVDVEGEDDLFDAKAELKRSFRGSSDYTNEECELIFASLVEHGDVDLALPGKSYSEVHLMKASMEALRSNSAHFERARSCDEMLHMAEYLVRESTKLEKAYKCVKKVLRLRNIDLLKKANKILSGSTDIDISVIRKIKYELIRTLALEWETQKKQRSKILSKFKSQPEPKNAPPEKKQRINEQPNFEMAKEGCKLDPRMEIQGSTNVSNMKSSCVKKLFEPVVETEVLEEPHVQLRILEAPEGSVDIETQFSVLENELVVQTQVELESTPLEKSKTPPQEKTKTPQVSDVINSDDDDDLLIIDLSGERSKENSPVKAAGRTSVDSANSSILDMSGKLKENSPVKSPEKTPEDSLKSSKPVPPLKKFPGLIPIYKSDLLNEERLSGKGPNTDNWKSDKSGPRGLANPIPENGCFKRTTISSKPDGCQEYSSQQQLSSNYRQGVDLVKGTLSYDSNYVLPPPGKSSLHSSNVQHKMVERPLTNSGPPEEITLDDSDDEAGMDYSKRTHNSHS